jgi:excisionase family DNA binding protein
LADPVHAQPQLSLDDVLSHANAALDGRAPHDARGSERDELLTADEVADRLRMTRAWVYSETRAERIPHLRLGRYIRYRRAAIEEWIVEMESCHQPGLLAPAAEDRRSGFSAR